VGAIRKTTVYYTSAIQMEECTDECKAEPVYEVKEK
jgi:hypothetical protein